MINTILHLKSLDSTSLKVVTVQCLQSSTLEIVRTVYGSVRIIACVISLLVD